MTSRARIVSDTELQAALDWLRDNADEMALAKERAVKAGHMLKHIVALEAKKHNDLSATAADREAKASDRFHDALTEDAVAAGELAKLYSLREAASLKIETWRTEQANFRKMSI